MKAILKEPLLHFLVLGALIFALYELRSEPNESADLEIVVSAETVANLVASHVQRTGSEPTQPEQEALIRAHVEEEVLYREAIALGLDQGDPIVRRRLVQSMSFLTEDLAIVPEPSEEELTQHLRENAQRYREPARWTIAQVFVSRQRHGADIDERAAALLDELRGGADHATLGEPFLRGSTFRRQSERDLDGVFGAGFASQLSEDAIGRWVGPVSSTYGLHLVRVEERDQSRLPPLAEVAEVVRRDWLEAHQSMANEAAVQALVDRYDIVIELPQ